MMKEFNETSHAGSWLLYESAHAHPYLQRFFVDSWKALLLSSSFGLLFWVVAIALMYSIRNRSKQADPVIFWLISLIALYLFGSSSFDSYRPVVWGSRYLVLVSLPAVLVAAFVLQRLLDDGAKGDERLRIGIVLLLFASGLGSIGLFLGEEWLQSFLGGTMAVMVSASYKLGFLLCLSLGGASYFVLRKGFGVAQSLGCILVTLFLPSSLYLTAGKASDRSGAEDVRRIREFLGDSFSGVVYLDDRSASILEYSYTYIDYLNIAIVVI